jgi:hypothetical protein
VRKLLGVGFPGELSRTETLMGKMEVGVPQEEIAAKVTEIRETDAQLLFEILNGARLRALADSRDGDLPRV